jgi:hypothetical protein
VANAQAMCTSFKGELLIGNHQLGACTLTSRGSLTAPSKDSIKAALFLASGSLGAATTSYTSVTASEVSGTGYSAGGITVTNSNDPTTSGTTAIWTPSASLVYSTVTLTTAFDCVLLYNASQNNKSISVHTFGPQTVTAGNFTLTMPTPDASNSLIRIA